jgi:gamma-glutamyltranspeptidase
MVAAAHPAATLAGLDVLRSRGIQSLYSAFGSGVVPPGTGIALHCRGAGFSLDPGSPSVLAPGKQPFHTLTVQSAPGAATLLAGGADPRGDGLALGY